ncbi:MAG: hypothetical protein IJM54_12160 [Thermoguttaceae bacterium]|nr:hypothetical protein [Thermoguttaceae bacterium]
MKEPSLESARDGATGPDDSELVLVFDEEELQDESWTPDPVDEEIAAYLDGEMSPEERTAFEAKVEASETIRAKLDAERSAWNALALLDEVEKPGVDLTESTLGRLSEETQAELQAADEKNKRRRLVLYATTTLGACALFVLGYFLSATFFPDLRQKRQKDCQVVDRLEQLGAVDSFEYLIALHEAKLFAPGPEKNDDAQSSDRRPNVNFFLPDFKPGPKKTYEELSQDRAFYRRELQFENLDELEKNKYRTLYRQIEAAPNSEELWTTANAYVFWLATAVNDAEIEQLQESSILKRIEMIKGRQEFFRRMQEFYSQARTSGFTGARASDDPQRRVQGSEPGARENRSPTAIAVRLTLPENLRDEDLSPIYRRYEEFRRKSGEESRGDSRQQGVFTFLTQTDNQELLALLSPKARDYLLAQPDADVSSALGLLVMLSFLENNNGGANNRANAQNGNRQQQRRQFANNGFDGGRWDRRWRFERNDYAPQNQNSVENLAKTLRAAPGDVKSYVVSSAPQAAMLALLGLHWNSGRRPNEGGSAPGPFSAPQTPPNGGFAPQGPRPFGNPAFPAPTSAPQPDNSRKPEAPSAQQSTPRQ